MGRLAGCILVAASIVAVSCAPVSAQPQRQTAAATGIVINEILAHTDPPQVDAVELHNNSAAAIDLSGWLLADDKNAEQRYVIPSGTVLAPDAYHLVPLDQDAPFRLSEFGETLYLFQPSAGAAPGPQVAQAKFGVSPNGVSFGPITLSTGEVRQVLLETPTLGAANSLPRIGPLVIDEVMYRPAADLVEYVGLRNASAQSAPLCDLARTGLPAILRVGGDIAMELPCGPLVEPGARFFVARAAPATFRAQYGIGDDVLVVGPFDGRLSNEGELIEIAWPQPPEVDGAIAYFALDQVDYGVAAPWPAIQADGVALVRRYIAAYGDDPANWQTSADPPVAPQVWLPWVKR